MAFSPKICITWPKKMSRGQKFTHSYNKAYWNMEY